ncbi:MAG: hypothetical protein JXX14_21405 [Deltaproteobacteria bacterium]|nr:hypothetical protein [Deltaproteobacteria bacterium]
MNRLKDILITKWRCRVLLFAGCCLMLSVAPLSLHADDGEFWDAAIASLVQTKRMEKSHFQLKAGLGVLGDLDTPTDTPATWRLEGEGAFYGFKLDRYERLFSLYGSLALGLGDSIDDSTTPSSLDAYRARLSVYHYLNGGAIAVGILSAEREKGVNEKFGAQLRSFEYAAGGAMKVFAVALTTSLLGYEFKRYYAKDADPDRPLNMHYRDDYHGLMIFELALKVGFVLGKRAPVSFETNLECDVEFSWPRQKDISVLAEMVGHLNSRVLPMDLSIEAGHRYATDDRDGEDGPEFHDSYYYTSALLGLRF